MVATAGCACAPSRCEFVLSSEWMELMSMRSLKSSFSGLVPCCCWGRYPWRRRNSPEFTELVQDAPPAVVNISTRQKLPQREVAIRGQMPDLEGLPPMFREFFERNVPQMPRGPGGRQREAQSLARGSSSPMMAMC